MTPPSWVISLKKKVGVKNEYIRYFLSEFFGTFVLVFMMESAIANATFSTLHHGKREPMNHFQVAFGAGFAVMCGVLVSNGASGSHLNPALSVAFAMFGHIPWKRLPVYMVAQYLGGFCAAAGTYFIFWDTFSIYDDGVRNVTGLTATAGIFSTYPQAHVSMSIAFIDQIIATSVLIFGVLAIVDEKNIKIPKNLHPLYFTLLVISIVLSLGYNTGVAMNPARDLPPRLFTMIAGWGTPAFSIRDHGWFWIPVIGSHLGAILGFVIYMGFIELHWPDEKKPHELEMPILHTPVAPGGAVYKVRTNSFGNSNQPNNEQTAKLLNN